MRIEPLGAVVFIGFLLITASAPVLAIGDCADLAGTIDLATGALTALATDNPTVQGQRWGDPCAGGACIFGDGFESGDTTAWN